MIDWYATVFEACVQHRDDRLAFMTYDDEHHRFAFANLGPLPADASRPRMGRSPGVNHVAYTWNDLGEIVELYERLKAAGITPVRPMRHGPTLSLYYADPDGNLMEFQIDVLDPAAANEFIGRTGVQREPGEGGVRPRRTRGALASRRRPHRHRAAKDQDRGAFAGVTSRW